MNKGSPLYGAGANTLDPQSYVAKTLLLAQPGLAMGYQTG